MSLQPIATGSQAKMEPQPQPPGINFDSTVLSQQADIPSQFIWLEGEAPTIDIAADEISAPVVDLQKFFSSDDAAATAISSTVAAACESHGFFQVINHGIDPALLAEACRCSDSFYALPLAEKQRARRCLFENHGYASSFTGRFDSKLPWKETLSFNYSAAPRNRQMVVDYFVSILGEEYRHIGVPGILLCDAPSINAYSEVLGRSLGISRGSLQEFFADADSVMRLNNYPPCQKPHLTLGTGPHCDPTSLTVLHQDEVGGLQVFVDGQWRSVKPSSDAFLINIGDTFMALTNVRYKSCVHRAVVNSKVARRSLAFFLNPQMDKVVRPPKELGDVASTRLYPEFTWRDFLEFTQKHYRADTNTLDAFSKWIVLAKGQA